MDSLSVIFATTSFQLKTVFLSDCSNISRKIQNMAWCVVPVKNLKSQNDSRICTNGLVSWWRHQMETYTALLALCAGNSPVQRPVMQSFDVFLDLRLNKRLSKQSWGAWLDMPSRSLWRHRVLHTPVDAVIEWAIVPRFSDRLAARKWLIESETKL